MNVARKTQEPGFPLKYTNTLQCIFKWEAWLIRPLKVVVSSSGVFISLIQLLPDASSGPDIGTYLMGMGHLS